MFKRNKKDKKDDKEEPVVKEVVWPEQAAAWKTDHIRFFVGQQRINIESGNRDVLLCCNEDGIQIFHPAMTMKYAEFPYTVIRRYKCNDTTQSFAFEEARHGQEPRVLEFYTKEALLLNETFNIFIQRIVQKRNEAKASGAPASGAAPAAAATAGGADAAAPKVASAVPAATRERLVTEDPIRRERSNSITKLLMNRPTHQELTERNIIKEGSPALQANKEDLVKRQRRDSISTMLANRPKKEELETKQILKPVTEEQKPQPGSRRARVDEGDMSDSSDLEDWSD